MKNFFRIIMIIMLAIQGMNQIANAQALDGSYTITQGNSITIQIGDAYVRTLKQASSVSGLWSVSSSAITIQSKTNTTCTIKGVTPATGVKLTYKCSYILDGFYRTMDFYYDITVKANVVYITSLTVSPETATMDIGETLQLSTKILPTNASNKNLNWTTENYSIASVSNSGLVTARGAGTVKIWARSTDGSTWADYCTITVNAPVKVESIGLSETERTMSIGEEFALTANVLPSNASNKGTVWTSSDDIVASVNQGVVKAVSPGECDITCSSADGSGVSAKCHITVSEPEQYWLSVILPNGSFSINVTEIESVNLKITPGDGYLIHSLQLDGYDLDFDEMATELSLPQFEHNSTITVVFIDNSATDIKSVNSDNINVSLSGNAVTVSGMAHREKYYLYDCNGRLLKEGQESTFTVGNHGIYLLRISSKTYKFAI